jgi:epoxyqueuosine reductase
MATESGTDAADTAPIGSDDDTLTVLTKSERRRRARMRALPTWGETPAQTRARRTRWIKEQALACGFSRVGVAEAVSLDEDRAALTRWLDAGMHGTMAWLASDVARRCDPRLVVRGAQSVIVLALDYDNAAPRTRAVALGRDEAWVSRYAWGDDYHLVAEKRLRALEARVTAAWREELGEAFRPADAPRGPFKAVRDFRWYVDHGPVLERAWGERAGLGWRGKHSLLVDPQRGSFFFLACIVTSIALDADAPQTDHCGSCTACIDACPTGAIVAERVVDARRCISHATIEVEGEIPEAWRGFVGDMVFGCDLCQDVCPFNRFSKPSGDPAFAAREGMVPLDLGRIDRLTADDLQHGWLARSPLKRRGVEGLRDNAAAVRQGRR